jgi:hypothetical protein
MEFEHGENAGGLYVLAYALPGMCVVMVCYILYFITDRITLHRKWNPLKNFIHLILGIALFWFPLNETFTIFILILSTVLVINLIALLPSSFEKNS